MAALVSVTGHPDIILYPPCLRVQTENVAKIKVNDDEKHLAAAAPEDEKTG